MHLQVGREIFENVSPEVKVHPRLGSGWRRVQQSRHSLQSGQGLRAIQEVFAEGGGLLQGGAQHLPGGQDAGAGGPLQPRHGPARGRGQPRRERGAHVQTGRIFSHFYPNNVLAATL